VRLATYGDVGIVTPAATKPTDAPELDLRRQDGTGNCTSGSLHSYGNKSVIWSLSRLVIAVSMIGLINGSTMTR
jgi:hypothetical protein